MPPKLRRKFHGLYYHSSPPKVFPMNGNSTSSKNSGRDDSKEVFVVKPSNIRIWIHDKDVGKLTRVLWAGQGNRLRQETSTNPRVRKFLETVPYILNVIKDVHQSVVDNNLDLLQSKTEPPVPPSLITTKDSNGLTILHKAAGLAHTRIVEYLLKVWPGGATDIDATGKTPLHWAASAKNNIRCYNLLVQAGADEEAIDHRMKTASYYKGKANEIDRSLLTVIPDAPRVPHENQPDWTAIVDEIGKLTNSDSPTDNNDNDDNGKENDKNDMEDSLLGNGMNLLTSRTKGNILDSNSEQDDDGDRNDNLTIEEQAVMDAIEDERIYEEMQTERDEKLNAEVNGNGNMILGATPPPTDDVSDFEDNNDETEQEENVNDDDEEDVEGIKSENKNDQLSEKAEQNEKADQIENAEQNENAEQSEKPEQNDGETATDETETNDNEKEIKDEDSSKEEEKRDDSKETDDEVQEEKKEEKNELKEVVKEQASAEVTQNSDETDNQNATEPKEAEESQKEPERDNNECDRMSIDNADISDNKNDSEDDKESYNEESIEAITKSPTPTSKSSNESDIDKTESKTDYKESSNKHADNDELNNIEVDENYDHKNTDNVNEQETENMDSINEAIIDENYNSIKGNVPRSITPSSPPLEYEGVVQGEADDNQVQSQSGGYFTNEPEQIQTIIDSGDMEQLATLVLNGEGKKMLGMKSSQPEIQAFLDNVPSYMNKIRRVHQAAREGNIRDVQAALDRRKFAIAKDEISPDGATPLHVATIFGHAGIIRYLGGRFPETTSAVDDNGRTALHYAASINDNGHFYNLLVNLGSNPKSLDKLGNSAEYYKENADVSKEVFSYGNLLRTFGADENLQDEMLRDQGYSCIGRQDETEGNLISFLSSKDLQIETILAELKSRYFERNKDDIWLTLTTALGDPLIKGLTEIAEKRPPEPILYLANYLENFVKNNTNRPIAQQQQHQQHYQPLQSTRLGTAASVSDQFGQSTNRSNNNNNNPAEEEFSSSPELDDVVEKDDRDEHGQSMLHFACARPHSQNALVNLIEESEINISYRDELYRTARDVSLQANQPGNAKQIDHYVLSLAAKGDMAAFENLITEGYDHILDINDNQGIGIIDFLQSRGHRELANTLESIHEFEESREELHQAIRAGTMDKVRQLTSSSDFMRLIKAKNYYGRTALHIAVLKENEAIVDYLTDACRSVLKVGDNLERTPLHYAMGINSVEKISRILIRKGAKRIVKDLKGRQPSYYFMNKADILRLQEEEDEEH